MLSLWRRLPIATRVVTIVAVAVTVLLHLAGFNALVCGVARLIGGTP